MGRIKESSLLPRRMAMESKRWEGNQQGLRRAPIWFPGDPSWFYDHVAWPLKTGGERVWITPGAVWPSLPEHFSSTKTDIGLPPQQSSLQVSHTARSLWSPGRPPVPCTWKPGPGPPALSIPPPPPFFFFPPPCKFREYEPKSWRKLICYLKRRRKAYSVSLPLATLVKRANFNLWNQPPWSCRHGVNPRERRLNSKKIMDFRISYALCFIIFNNLIGNQHRVTFRSTVLMTR